jgi:hypothetical protein
MRRERRRLPQVKRSSVCWAFSCFLCCSVKISVSFPRTSRGSSLAEVVEGRERTQGAVVSASTLRARFPPTASCMPRSTPVRNTKSSPSAANLIWPCPWPLLCAGCDQSVGNVHGPVRMTVRIGRAALMPMILPLTTRNQKCPRRSLPPDCSRLAGGIIHHQRLPLSMIQLSLYYRSYAIMRLCLTQ